MDFMKLDGQNAKNLWDTYMLEQSLWLLMSLSDYGQEILRDLSPLEKIELYKMDEKDDYECHLLFVERDDTFPEDDIYENLQTIDGATWTYGGNHIKLNQIWGISETTAQKLYDFLNGFKQHVIETLQENNGS